MSERVNIKKKYIIINGVKGAVVKPAAVSALCTIAREKKKTTKHKIELDSTPKH